MGEEEIRCSCDDSSLEQCLLLILRYDYPKTSTRGACLPFSSNVREAGSHAARHVTLSFFKESQRFYEAWRRCIAAVVPPACMRRFNNHAAPNARVPAHSRPDGLCRSPPVRAQISKATCKRSAGRAELSPSFSLAPSDHSTCLLCHLLHYAPGVEKNTY